MKKIEVSEDFFDLLRKKSDPKYERLIRKIFLKNGYKIDYSYNAPEIVETSDNTQLAEDLFLALSSVSFDDAVGILDLLLISNYPKDVIAEWIVEQINLINSDYNFTNEIEHITWFFCEDLRQLKQLKYFDEYVKILNMKKLSTCRIPIVELVSCSRRKDVTNILLSCVDDSDINGHVFYALNRRHYDGILNLARRFVVDDREFVRKLATRIIKKNSIVD